MTRSFGVSTEGLSASPAIATGNVREMPQIPQLVAPNIARNQERNSNDSSVTSSEHGRGDVGESVTAIVRCKC